MRLYVGINEQRWNHHATAPGPYACIAPVYGKTKRTKRENRAFVPHDTAVISDSGAFSDDPKSRTDFDQALRRQIKHGEKYGYLEQIEAFASYDLLIDEKWEQGVRSKHRWTTLEAESAVRETIAAAQYIHRHRHLLPSQILVLSAQGISTQQYLHCVQEIGNYFQGGDILGLGGWCIIGKHRSLMKSFREIIQKVVPLAATFCSRIHIWGVLYAPAIGELLWLCDQHGLELSTDSSGPSTRPVFGQWGYMGWRNKAYKRPPVETRGLERARHVIETRKWLSDFRNTKYYREYTPRDFRQMSLSEVLK